ncbi:unnamed protein product [Arabidopsis halleri]
MHRQRLSWKHDLLFFCTWNGMIFCKRSKGEPETSKLAAFDLTRDELQKQEILKKFMYELETLIVSSLQP